MNLTKLSIFGLVVPFVLFIPFHAKAFCENASQQPTDNGPSSELRKMIKELHEADREMDELLARLDGLAYFEYFVERTQATERQLPKIIEYEGYSIALADVLPMLEGELKARQKDFFGALEKSKKISVADAKAQIALKVIDLKIGAVSQEAISRLDIVSGASQSLSRTVHDMLCERHGALPLSDLIE